MKGSTTFGSVSIQLASSELIKSLSYGEVKKPETINYRTLRPERDGLFCERIFGPTKDYECSCGKFRSIRYRGIVCDKCGVEVTESKVRRYRTGHIELAAPIAHIWYYRIVPSKIALLLDVPPSDIQSILYFEKYIVIDQGETDLLPSQVLTDEEYDEYREKYKEAFAADTGAIAIKKILLNLDLDMLSDELRHLIEHKQAKVDKKVLKRLELVEELRKSGNKPEWMILDIIPVIPPDLRPMVPLDGGRFATSDINDLYRRLINRNNRLKKLKSVNAPDIIIKNEMRMVQDAVDSLFDNSRRSHPVTGNGDRPLKSLSDILKGKQGRFRQNLLGKRVDYSGRSVIIVGPNLKLHQCGLPKQMALELFKPFVMRGLVEQGYAHNIKAAKRMIETEHELVWGILENVVADHPVLLNRAPTLHRLGIQAFEPILIEEKAIQLHPLVCHAYNADFDGDQMAVHVPLTPEAQIEAWILMLSSRNLLNPANGKPIVYPTQDMVLGIYYLTKKVGDHDPKTLRYYDTVEELIFAVENKSLSYNTPINYVWKGTRIYDTTVGRVLFNQIIPEKLGYINDTLTSKKLEGLIAKSFNAYGIKETAQLVDNLKATGYRYATIFGVTIAISDVEIPEEKYNIVAKTEKDVENIEDNARKGLITHDEKYNQVVDLWASANEKIKKLVEQKLKDSNGGFNSLYIMMDSGARGSREQIRQLAGMRGLMAKPSGEIMELAIKSNFKEGLSVLEYFISSHGARKGLADTALKTADAGYLTRKLVDIAHDVVVSTHDCHTVKGIDVSAIKQGDEVIKPLADRILGRVSVSNVYDPRNGNLILKENSLIDEDTASIIEKAGIESVKIRSVLNCEARQGVCARCYGWDLSSRKLVNIGEAVGIIAAESIGQPGTQLTMRTFHIGGTAATQVGENNVKLNYGCVVLGSPFYTHEKIRKSNDLLKFAKRNMNADEYAKFEASKEGNPLFYAMLNEKLKIKDFYNMFTEDEYGNWFDKETAIEICSKITDEEILHFNSWLFDRMFKDNIVKGDEGLPDSIIYRINTDGKVEKVVTRKSTIRVHKIIEVFTESEIIAPKLKEMEGVELGSEEEVFKKKDGTSIKFGNRVRVITRGDQVYVIESDVHEYTIKMGTLLYILKGQIVKKNEVLAEFDSYNDHFLSEYNSFLGYAYDLVGDNLEKNRNSFVFYNVKEESVMTLLETTKKDRERDEGKSADHILLAADALMVNEKTVVKKYGYISKERLRELRDGGVERIKIWHRLDYTPKDQGTILEKEAREILEKDEFAYVKAGHIFAKRPIGKKRTRDIIGGLPRVTELFESRKPKNTSVIAKVNGIVTDIEQKKGRYIFWIKAKNGQLFSHTIPGGKNIYYRIGDRVQAGESLCDGVVSPHDILKVQGYIKVEQFLLEEIQSVYRLQGVDINEKHISIIVRQMLKKIEIVDEGDTEFIIGQSVDNMVFDKENESVVKQGGQPAKSRPMLMGLTKAALFTESFFSAASFQETPRVLSIAALKGARDRLQGLKENLVIGQLIPAGTGIKNYAGIKLRINE